MEKIAFRMTLKPGGLDAYRQRHDTILPDLVHALKTAGIHDHSIPHDAPTNALFATLWRDDAQAMDALPTLDVMRRWWAWMAPPMETNPHGSPISGSARNGVPLA